MTKIGLAATAVASGVEKDATGTQQARITLVLHPSNTSTKLYDLSSWPLEASKIVLNSPLKIAVNGGHEIDAKCLAIPAKPAWNECASSDVVDLWRRLLVEGPGRPTWNDYSEAFDETCHPPSPKPQGVLAPPHGEAALAYTLLRGRTVLNTLGASGAAIHARAAPLGSVRSVASRPWLGRNQRPVEFASAAATASDAVPPSRNTDWLAPYREATAAALDDRPHRQVFPPPLHFAEAALGKGASLDETLDKIQAAHHYATPLGPHSKEMPETAAVIAKRCVGALLALPVLQRLFGLAWDVFIPLEELIRKAAANGEITLAPDGDRRCWTLAHVSADGFYPLSRTEAGLPERSDTRCGMRDLGQTREGAPNTPRYDLCTMDPVLAAESDNNRAQSGAEDAIAGQPELRHGGLRLLDGERAVAVAREAKANALAHDAAAACGKGDKPVLKDADDLVVGDRLLIGMMTAKGLVWRSPQYRHIIYIDPVRRQEPDWIEDELRKRKLDKASARRMELDSAVTQQATIRLPNPAPEDASPQTLDALFASDQATLLADATLVSWGGAPMGASPPPLDCNLRPQRRDVRAVWNELYLTRKYAPPSLKKKDVPAHLSPILRFGYPYHVVELRTFQGGAGLSLDEAAVAVNSHPSLALPALRVADGPGRGRRMLRHEIVHAPWATFPAKHLQRLNLFATHSAMPMQGATGMVVRSGTHPSRSLMSTRRIVLPPTVPLFFATLHDVLRGKTDEAPPNGLPGLRQIAVQGLPRDGEDKTTVTAVDVESGSKGTFIPDPAAQTLVLRLRLPDTGSKKTWLEEPLFIEIAGKWPEVRPVELELQAVAAASGTRVRLAGQGRLGAGAEPAGKFTATGPAVEKVVVALGRGEDVVLDAWFVPSAQQLAGWFDACEAAALLATVEGGGTNPRDPAAACIQGLRELLGAPLSAPAGSTATSCSGLGGLPLPSLDEIDLVARMLRQAMLSEPVDVISATLSVRLTHAIDTELLMPITVAPAPVLVRRRFVDTPEMSGVLALLTFLGETPSDWSLRDSQDGAQGVLLGGSVKYDPASTVGFNIVGACEAPTADALPDQADVHFKDWPHVNLLTISGLPGPSLGQAGSITMDLNQLMSAALGSAKPLGSGLRAVMGTDLATRGARRFRVAAIPVNRHSELMAPLCPEPDSKFGWSKELILPATLRPAPPAIDRLQQMLMTRTLPEVRIGTSVTVGVTRDTVIRIWLSDRVLTSGYGERLAIVMWPPEIFSNGSDVDDKMEKIDVEAFLDSDLGPGGRFVSRWGADAQRDGLAPTTPLLTPDVFGYGGVKGLDESAPAFKGRAWMPIPVESPLAGEPVTATTVIGDYMAVALLTFAAAKDGHGNRYVDVPIHTAALPRPRVRLGLVRYQEHSREDETPPEGEEPVRLRVSIPVTEWTQPLPSRIARATTERSEKKLVVTVTLTGVFAAQVGETNSDEMTGREHGPDKPEMKGGPVVSMELRRSRDGLESPVLDRDGRAMACSNVGDKPGIHGAGRDEKFVWAGRFELEGGFESGWEYAVTIRERERLFSAADPAPEASKLEETGNRFFAQLKLVAP